MGRAKGHQVPHRGCTGWTAAGSQGFCPWAGPSRACRTAAPLLSGGPQHAHAMHRGVGLRDPELPHGYVEEQGGGHVGSSPGSEGPPWIGGSPAWPRLVSCSLISHQSVSSQMAGLGFLCRNPSTALALSLCPGAGGHVSGGVEVDWTGAGRWVGLADVGSPRGVCVLGALSTESKQPENQASAVVSPRDLLVQPLPRPRPVQIGKPSPRNKRDCPGSRSGRTET